MPAMYKVPCGCLIEGQPLGNGESVACKHGLVWRRNESGILGLDRQSDVNEELIVAIFSAVAQDHHNGIVLKGFYEPDRMPRFGELIAMAHSELSEALENDRRGRPPDSHLPQYDGATVELADVILRVFDMCVYLGFPIGEAVWAKTIYNRGRAKKHGKGY